MKHELDFFIKILESEINRLENNYKENHKNDFEHEKMRRHINRKLKKELQFLTQFNLRPSLEILNNSERFKY